MRFAPYLISLAALALAGPALAHGIAGADAAFVASSKGAHVIPFIYLGAKHMVTGYDHLLFLLGVIFFLRRPKDVALYVTLFSVGHSITLLAGVLGNIRADAHLVDAVIGLSVVYKAFDNLGGFQTLLKWRPDTRVAVAVFGLFHGFGLATKLQELKLNADGLLANMLSFNLGVELGQLAALGLILVLMTWWRRAPGFSRQAVVANGVIMAAGFTLIAYQLAGHFTHAGA